MNKVQILPEALASQIAAGEVVERPASVVKELVENALDAEARSIFVFIEKSGKERIRVVDDGLGMSAEDARRALERHATSKLRSAADLSRIRTLGFRGEALPSIASVSELTLLTREEASAAGCEIVVEGGREVRSREVGLPRGTTVEVRQLFFNVPARRKFLRADVTEAAHIAELVANLAAAHPEVHFRLEHGARTLLDWPAVGTSGERLYQIEGGWVESAIAVEESIGNASVRAWLSPPAEERGASSRLHLFVNGRPVKDRVLSHAVVEAYRQASSKPGTPRAYVFLEIAPEKVDVNVHPAKVEVRFVDQGFVHQVVFNAVKNSLQQGGKTPEIWAAPPLGEARVSESSASYGGGGLAMAEALWGGEPLPRTFSELAGAPPAPLGQFRSSFIVAADGDAVWLVDQHAAHERILYEELLARTNGAPPQQMLLTALPLELGPAERVTLEAELPRLLALGFDLEPFGGNSILVRAVPATVPSLDVEGLLRAALVEPESECRAGALSELEKRIAARIACHAAIKINMPLAPEKTRYVLERLWKCAEPTVCPHGRPTTLRVGREQVERTFGRI